MKIIDNIKTYKKFFLSFVIIDIILFTLLYWNSELKKEDYLAETTHQVIHEYHVILNTYEQKAEIAYDILINNAPVKTLLQEALDAKQIDKDKYRRQLYALLLPKFEELKKFGFKQLHFHQPDNHSFLRMHNPKIYGDDLSTFRKTVTYVNDTNQKISGFEEGLATNGYRFVFPLFNQNRYLGSVELSFSAYALSDFLKNKFLDTHFIISKKALYKIDPSYITSHIDKSFVTDKAHQNTTIIFSPEKYLQDFSQKFKGKGFSLAVETDTGKYIETFIPVKNPVSKNTNAYMIILSDGKYLTIIEQNAWLIFAGLNIILMLLFFYFIKEKQFRSQIKNKHSVLTQTNKKLKTIIDSQENMIIITNSTKMSDVNAKLLTFLGYSSFEQLIKHHKCICDFFLKHKDYFHLGKLPANSNWIDHLENLPLQERVVNMVGINIEPKAFQVNISKYDNKGSSIITFTDITDIVIQQKILQYKAQHDRLTDIYNRQKIDEILEKICGYSRRRKEEIGVIMFDIDHFKSVNDTYGHDTGDEVLKAIAKLIQKNIREDDIFGRWGGEEFLIILRHTSIENTFQKARLLRKAIEEMRYKKLPKVTASFGVTEVIPNDTPQALLKRVDLALYKAKSEGRNRVTLSSVHNSQLILSQ